MHDFAMRPENFKVDANFEPDCSHTVPLVEFDPHKTCNYCHHRGHWKTNCPSLKAKANANSVQIKSVALAAPVGSVVPASSLCVLRKHTF